VAEVECSARLLPPPRPPPLATPHTFLQDYFKKIREMDRVKNQVKLPYQVRHLTMEDMQAQRYSRASHNYSSTAAAGGTEEPRTPGAGGKGAARASLQPAASPGAGSHAKKLPRASDPGPGRGGAGSSRKPSTATKARASNAGMETTGGDGGGGSSGGKARPSNAGVESTTTEGGGSKGHRASTASTAGGASRATRPSAASSQAIQEEE
jgi:hypothetical protein